MGRHSRILGKLLQNVALVTAASVIATQTWAQADQEPRETTPHFPRVDQPSLNFYGLPGLIDLPTGEALPDGQFAISYSSFVGGNRTNFTFQATPRITATFRYIGVDNLNLDGFVDYRDRSFDVKYLLFREGKYVPSVAVGLQDFAGTGIYAGEYVAATKTFQTTRLGTIKITGGLGWGRLGSSGSFTSIGGPRPEFDATSTGGSLSVGQWFRGPVAAFGGVEWQVSDRLGLKAELSSDAYEIETRQGLVDLKTQLNFGAEYQFSDRLRVGGYYLYGSEFGFNLQLQFNPKNALTPKTIAAPTPILPRPERRTSPDAWQSEWASVETIPEKLQDIIAPALRAEGLTLQEFSVSAHVAEVRFTNGRHRNTSLGIGRVARVLARILPASVETFRIVPVVNGLPLSTVVLRRSDLEALEFQPNNADALLAVTGIGDATPQLDDKVFPPELTQKFSYSVGPYVNPSYFDPDRPVRFDAGVRAEFRYRFSPGWLLAGEVRHSLAGDVEDSVRVSNSRIEPVRTNGVLYARATDTSLHQLYLSRQWKPANNIYARTSVGYFEQMFGGISGEVLWKPSASRLALGVEVNYVGQREFEQRFGFQDYSVATGHVSAYYDFENGFNAQVDVGRYLAGDVGGTFTLTREFKNGWRVGGFFTLTNVSAEDFGEGSFDKGFIISAPLEWFLGKPSQRRIGTVVRPIQRDGGARVHVPGRLYEQVRTGHKATLIDEWSRVWE